MEILNTVCGMPIGIKTNNKNSTRKLNVDLHVRQNRQNIDIEHFHLLTRTNRSSTYLVVDSLNVFFKILLFALRIKSNLNGQWHSIQTNIAST